MADLSKAEKLWNARITDETLSDEERKEAAREADKIAKRRKKKSRYKTKATTIENDPAPVWYPLDGNTAADWRDFQERVAAWDRRHPKAAKAAKAVAELPPAPIAASVESAPAPAVRKPAPAPAPAPAPVEEADPVTQALRLLDRMEAKAKTAPAVGVRPVPQSVVQPYNRKYPLLEGATVEESESIWLLNGWGNRMTSTERAKHSANRDAYNQRMREKREDDEAVRRAMMPVKSAEEIADEERARQERAAEEEQIKIRAFAAPEYCEPNLGNPLSLAQLQEVTKSTMANATDAGISIGPNKPNTGWLPDESNL